MLKGALEQGRNGIFNRLSGDFQRTIGENPQNFLKTPNRWKANITDKATPQEIPGMTQRRDFRRLDNWPAAERYSIWRSSMDSRTKAALSFKYAALFS